MDSRLYIQDDLGIEWYFHDGRIKAVLSTEEEAGIPDNGYPCASFEEGVFLLKDYGYLNDFNAEVALSKIVIQEIIDEEKAE